MRVQQTVALQEPDRVPFIPTWNNFYQLEYGVSFGESMRDPFALNAALDHVLGRYEPDLVYMPTVFPSLEDTDLVQAKKILGNVACIGAGMPTEYLMMGDKQRVVDHTKKMIDLLAPGGGFIMTNTIAIDQVKTENLEAWKDTVFEYGKYR